MREPRKKSQAKGVLVRHDSSVQADQVVRSADEATCAPIRVVVCDDSPFMQRLVSTSLKEQEVVAVVDSAQAAIDACRSLMPDVLTLDLELGSEDGISVLRAVRELPVQVVVISAFTAHVASERSRNALANGAAQCIGKPGLGEDVDEFAERVVRVVGEASSTYVGNDVQETSASEADFEHIFVLGASTGGTTVLGKILKELPHNFPAPVLVVQHIPEHYSLSFVSRLNASCEIDVQLADGPLDLRPGLVVVANGGSHLRVDGATVQSSDGNEVNGYIPSIDVTLVDAVAAWGSRVRAVILTGMGKDGTDGARAVSAAGGLVVAQSQASCAVYGMSRSVLHAGFASEELDLAEISAWMLAEVKRDEH